MNESNNGTQPYMQNRVYDSNGIAPAVTLFANQMKVKLDENYTYQKATDVVRNHEFTEGEVKAIDFYNRSVRDDSPTLTDPKHNAVGVFEGRRIRRLTPIECERLQGFPDNHTKFGMIDGKTTEMANTHRYKQCGNAVTVDVVEAVAKRIKLNHLL
jgi:DNA (cytosine-5)-methyltransferase 1